MKRAESQDDFWMAKALSLASRGAGCTRPNPPVGAVVVDENGQMIAGGYHHRAGGPHAEVVALRKAGDNARGAVLYVTLEPCSTHGRTPPCTQAILDAGVKRAVVAVTDPNPKHRGRGIRLLRRAGIEVAVGVGRDEAQRLLAPFAHWITTGRPYVSLKLGMTTDGRIADRKQKSKWITGAQSRKRVQNIRKACDAIMVGSGTAVADDPSLLPRARGGGRPWRVVVDSKGSLSPGSQVLTDGEASRTIIATTRGCSEKRREAYASRGAEVLVLPSRGTRVSLAALMRELGKRGILHLLCEGGGELATALVRGRLVNEFLFFVAPLVLGAEGVGAFAGGWALKQAPRLRFQEVVRAGDDVMIRAVPAQED